MKKKSVVIAACLSAVMCTAPAFIACGGGGVPKHEHTLFKTEAVAATCIAEGNKEYRECIYCNDIFINGVQMTREDTVVAIDPNNHTHLTEHELEPAKCFADGKKAHTVCDGCGKIFVDGAETEEADLAIEQLGAHTWENTECSMCDAYKMTVGGEEAIIDEHSRVEIKAAGNNSFGNDKTVVNPELIANPGKWACQTGGTPTSTASISNNVLKMSIKSDATKQKSQSFTRFIPSQDGTTAYVGKFLLVFDFKVTGKLGSAAKPTFTMAFNVQNEGGTNLFGPAKANEVTKEFDVGKTYRFAIAVDLSSKGRPQTDSVDTFIQLNIRNGANSGGNIEIANANVVYLNGGTGANKFTSVKGTDAFNDMIVKEF